MIVVYTVAFGMQLPPLSEPFYTSSDVRYVCYADSVGSSSIRGWEVLSPQQLFPHWLRKQARWHKVLSHRLFPDAEFTLWLDADMTLRADPRELTAKYLPLLHDIIVFRHPKRTCVYQELEACLRYRKDNPERMRAQIRRYKHEGYPYHRGLAETSVLLRRHTLRVVELNELWWAEIHKGSIRDQLSFDYCTWKLKMPVRAWPGSPEENPCTSCESPVLAL